MTQMGICFEGTAWVDDSHADSLSLNRSELSELEPLKLGLLIPHPILILQKVGTQEEFFEIPTGSLQFLPPLPIPLPPPPPPPRFGTGLNFRCQRGFSEGTPRRAVFFSSSCLRRCFIFPCWF